MCRATAKERCHSFKIIVRTIGVGQTQGCYQNDCDCHDETQYGSTNYARQCSESLISEGETSHTNDTIVGLPL